MTLVIHADRPLLVTQVPLVAVPDGCVNLHGHLHGTRVPGATPHINVSVEQLDYRPQRLTDIRRLAAWVVAGGVVPGRTTAQQLAHAL